MDDKGAFGMRPVARPQGRQRFQRPRIDPAVARQLPGAEFGQEIGSVGRLRTGRIIQVPARITAGRIIFIDDRRVHPFGQRMGAADMGGEQHDAIGGR